MGSEERNVEADHIQYMYIYIYMIYIYLEVSL